MCVCITESLCCITEIKHNIANQLYLNKIKKQNQKNPKDLSSELTLLLSKEIKPVGLKRDQPWIFTGRTDAEAEAPVFWSSDANRWLIGKVPDAGKYLLLLRA